MGCNTGTKPVSSKYLKTVTKFLKHCTTAEFTDKSSYHAWKYCRSWASGVWTEINLHCF